MRAFVSAIVMIFVAQGALAESIYCTFTEPFMTVVYNSDTNTVKVTDPEEGDQEMQVTVEFQQGGVLMLMDLDKTHALKIDLNREGSDGMSDFIYPFEATLDGGLYGGCETDHLKKRM
ncbi:hypothetical protein D3C72_1472840 [compost metagenome]